MYVVNTNIKRNIVGFEISRYFIYYSIIKTVLTFGRKTDNIQFSTFIKYLKQELNNIKSLQKPCLQGGVFGIFYFSAIQILVKIHFHGAIFAMHCK
jgi:hypothetical protein